MKCLILLAEISGQEMKERIQVVLMHRLWFPDRARDITDLGLEEPCEDQMQALLALY